MNLASTLKPDGSALRSLPASVAAGVIVAFPIPPAPGIWPFLKLTVAGVVAGALYGSIVPGTDAGQSHMMRGSKAGMAVGLPAFFFPAWVYVWSIDVLEYLGPLVLLVFMLGPFMTLLGAIPGAVGGALGHRILSMREERRGAAEGA